MPPKETRQLPAEERRALGARIVACRGAKPWSQRELSRRTGLRHMRLSRIENGHVSPSLYELLRIAEALDISLEEIVQGALPEGSQMARYFLPPLKELEAFGSPQELAVLGTLLRLLVAGFKATRPGRAESRAGDPL